MEYEKFVINFSLRWPFLQLVSKIKYNYVSFVVKYFSFDSFFPEMFYDWKAVPISTRSSTVDKSYTIKESPLLTANNEFPFGVKG